MDPAKRQQIVLQLDRAFGGAEDASPTETHDLHVLLTNLELPPPWKPSPTRALAIFHNWPHERPQFFVDHAVTGESNEPPRGGNDAYQLDETWRGFSWTAPWSGDDPVRVIQLWLNRFTEST
jgi:hypothetical protein